MMKAYINIKNNSNLHTHQTLNKSIWLMKRESGRSPIHHFSFGERFDEKMLRVHPSGGQCVMLSIHHFIRFSPLIKSNGKATEVNTAIRRLVGRTSILPTDRGKPMLQAKREQHPKTADTAAGFWKTKSHSLLGRFLHAPLRSC
ncbi:hypothetical protein [Phocaeicola coprocola]|uniref:hypothetical protein n=1 Tax=Phocaeicola coprocola TaxID=310298 RepID=UPI0026DCD5BD|nr:hypothetical protein [Phocaeicola coprocola]